MGSWQELLTVVGGTVIAGIILGAIAFAYSLHQLISSMDFSLKSLTGQNKVIVDKIEQHSVEIGGLRVEVAEIRGHITGKNEPK